MKLANCNNQFVSALLTQISWTNHLLILSKSKSDEEQQFYLHLSIKEKYTSREEASKELDGYLKELGDE